MTPEQIEQAREVLSETMISLQSAVAQHLCDRLHDADARDADPCVECTESAADLLGLRWDQRVLAALASLMPQATETVEWGVRHGDGDVLDGWSHGRGPETYVRDQRQRIARGAIEADDYEPMTVVRRTVTSYAPVVGEREAVDE